MDAECLFAVDDLFVAGLALDMTGAYILGCGLRPSLKINISNH